MFTNRSTQRSTAFGPDGRRAGGGPKRALVRKPFASCSTSSNKLFQKGSKLLVQRASLIPGLSVSTGGPLIKQFQRPMQKRRAYDKNANNALKTASLGVKRRFDGMAKLMARAGKGLSYKLPQRKGHDGDATDGSSDDSDEEEKPDEKPFEPLQLWATPRGEDAASPKGLPPQQVTITQPDEFGIDEQVTVMKPAPINSYSSKSVFVPPVLAKWLRPHQREGVKFVYECVMSLKDFRGAGCILADDMGLGKTLQSVALIYTLLKTGITADGQPTAKRVIVVCPCSLVKNWNNEFIKWLGPNAVKALPLAESDRKTVEKNLDIFVRTKMFNVLIVSYETIRTHIKRLIKHKDCCDLLVCDEAHRLKNSENQTSKALNSLPVKRRVLLTGTPMQNNLLEFFAMVDFTNPGVLGTPEEFRKKILAPCLRGREPDATDAQKKKMRDISVNMSQVVNQFILRRINTINAKHLPPKLVQIVCCKLTSIQQNMYQQLVSGKETSHVLEGKQENCLGYIQLLMKLCNHPSLIVEEPKAQNGRRAASKNMSYADEESSKIEAAQDLAKFLPYAPSGGKNSPVFPEWSGKMFILYRLMKEMRKPGNGNDKIVIVSNYTQTLDLIGRMCRENSWGSCRLDGSVTMKKRQKMVDEFNDPCSTLVAFLLSSKAGGCGLNLIGGNRLVLFDCDWNPAIDKQAAARCWRDGQKKRCFTYKFLTTGTLEEKIYQRQLAKEGLQQIVDDKEQVNALSTKDLRQLFKLRVDTPSDTHDKLRCQRCKIIDDNVEDEAKLILPAKLAACRKLLETLMSQADASYFLKPLVSTDHDVTTEEYERLVKQPMDLGTILLKLNLSPEKPNAYTAVSGFSKDVNRIFGNVLKVWSPGQGIADAARRLQGWWIQEWTALVPQLLIMRHESEESSPQKSCEDPDICQPVVERGDDYQEQIGMPDEENMRDWSHHHTSATVDDPVFRAAMSGSDSVSFIFGLEVTWSLIQQRQQEEEEELAMKELAEAQRCTNDDDSDDDEDGDESDDSSDSGSESGNAKKDEEGGGGEEDGVGDFVVDDDASEGDGNDDFVANDDPVADEDADEPEGGAVELEDSDDDEPTSTTNRSHADEQEGVGAELEDSDDDEPTSTTSRSDVDEQDSDDEPAEANTISSDAEEQEENAAELDDSDEEETESQMETEVAHDDAAGDASSSEGMAVDQSPSDSDLVEGGKKWACYSCTLHNDLRRKSCSACTTKRPVAKKQRL